MPSPFFQSSTYLMRFEISTLFLFLFESHTIHTLANEHPAVGSSFVASAPPIPGTGRIFPACELIVKQL